MLYIECLNLENVDIKILLFWNFVIGFVCRGFCSYLFILFDWKDSIFYLEWNLFYGNKLLK